MDAKNTAVQDLQALRRKCQTLFVIHVLLYAAALGLLFWKQQVGIAVGVANAVFYFLVVKRSLKRYSEEFGKAIVRFGLWEGLERVDWTDALSTAAFRDLHLLPHPTGDLLCRRRWAGRRRDISFSCAEITFHYETQVNGRRDFRFLNGTLLIASLPKSQTGDTLILHRQLLTEEAGAKLTAAGKYMPVELSKNVWTERYCVWSQDGFLSISSSTMETVKKLGGIGAMRVSGTELAVFLPDRFYFPAKILPRTAPTAALLSENPLPELNRFLRLAEQIANGST